MNNTLRRSMIWPLLLLTLTCFVPSHAELVVVVGAGSTVSTLSKEQLIDLYLRRLKDFPGSNDTATPLIYNSGPLRSEFLQNVLGRSDAQVKAIWARYTFTGKAQAPRTVENPEEVKQLLAAHPKMIGYLNRGDVDASVKVVLVP
ncbi:type 2 periplasmic-binding domain-containing protein [Parachitinimonas caeni]|uniref:Phosphate ABC transporter substrate-binding protein n=1 Tax=Parachitinimonas caeni TaxID=3031301 RepID=A0ABT7DWW5_9NEIS|nr:phosphate ABC transporter substrate-binding protein [Parachitinimonas caeni]MDK2124562.1 phosphate ABC transporter substrate-binding protein [Parachitinimonas caeni]